MTTSRLLFPLGCALVCELACAELIEVPLLWYVCYTACYNLWLEG